MMNFILGNSLILAVIKKRRPDEDPICKYLIIKKVLSIKQKLFL
jgi:hypothetical protein